MITEEVMMYAKFSQIYGYWLTKAPMVFKAISCRPPYEIPHVSLRDTTWGKSIKALYGKEYDER